MAKRLTVFIVIGLLLGIVTGLVLNGWLDDGTPEAAARSSTTCAWLIIGASTILPLSDTTPKPALAASSAALITFSA